MSWRSDRGGKRLSLDSGVSLGCPGLSLAWEVVTCQHNTQQWRKKAMITLLLIKYYNWNLKTRFAILNVTVPSLILFSERGSSSRRSTSTEMAESPRRSSSGSDSLESESDWNMFFLQRVHEGRGVCSSAAEIQRGGHLGSEAMRSSGEINSL